MAKKKTTEKARKSWPGRNGGTLVQAPAGAGGRPKGSRSWKTILREIGDQMAPDEVQAILKAGGKKATYREAAAIIAYRRAMLMDAVGNAAFDKIADREDGKPVQPITGEEGGAVQVEVRFPEI